MSAFPLTPIITDAVGHADEATLSDGGKWGAAILPATDFGLKILTNEIVGKGASNSSALTTATYGPDAECYVVNTGSDLGTHLALRINGSGATATGYQVFFDASANTVSFERWDAGVLSTISGPTTVAAYGFADQKGARITDRKLTAFVNGVVVAQFADSTYAGTGQIGMRVFSTQMPISSVGGGTIIPGLEPKARPSLVYLRKNR